MHVKELISEHGKHLQLARGVAESTRHQYIHYVQRFLSEAFTDFWPKNTGHLFQEPDR